MFCRCCSPVLPDLKAACSTPATVQDHRYNNPARVVFTELLIERLNYFREARRKALSLARLGAAAKYRRRKREESRESRARQSTLSRDAVLSDAEAQRRPLAGLASSKLRLASTKLQEVRKDLSKGLNDQVQEGFNARFMWLFALRGVLHLAREREAAQHRRVRNRWYRTRMLFFNPALRHSVDAVQLELQARGEGMEGVHTPTTRRRVDTCAPATADDQSNSRRSPLPNASQPKRLTTVTAG